MKKRILIVEDDITLEPFWQIAIQKADPRAEVAWVCSETDAEREWNRSLDEGRPFDVVITDLFLSGPKTGIELWERVSEDMRSRMVLTSGIHPEKFRRYFGDQTISPPFLQKPYSLSETVETLRWMLGTEDGDNNKTISPSIEAASTQF